MPAGQGAWAFALAVGLVVFLRVLELDTLQTEVYGDIEIVFSYVGDILRGKWPMRFTLSAGPLYHYLIAPIILVTGLNYLGLKLASVIVSLAGLAATYAFSRRLVNDAFALLVTFIAGVSSWLLIFSRLGNSQIVQPLLTMGALWLVVRIVQLERLRDVAGCAAVAGLGLLAYPASFVLPGVIFLTLLCLQWAGQKLPRGWAWTFILASIPSLILFAMLVAADPANFVAGYVGDKIHPETGRGVWSALGNNVWNALLALHARGDGGFRSNPIALPHLDPVSGVLLLVGIGFWLIDAERRRWAPVWLVPLILLQAPSVLALNQQAEVPSASRTLGVAPIVYVLVASGLWWPGQLALARDKMKAAVFAVSCLILGSILLLNARRYFYTYLDNLPDNDTPIGYRIATYANSLPSSTQVHVVGCCWEYGMPERFIEYSMTHPENLHYTEKRKLSCTRLQTFKLPAVLVWSFHDTLPSPQLEACKLWLPTQQYEYQGRPVFNAAPLGTNLVALSDFPLPGETLDHDEIQLNGQTVAVDYSPIDIGSIGDLFDGDRDVLIRGERANPMVVVLHFDPPRTLSTLDLDLGSMAHFRVTAVVIDGEKRSGSVSKDYEGLPDDPHVTLALPESARAATSVRVMVQDMDPLAVGEPYHIHLRELSLR
jgi:hypothetical protein